MAPPFKKALLMKVRRTMYTLCEPNESVEGGIHPIHDQHQHNSINSDRIGDCSNTDDETDNDERFEHFDLINSEYEPSLVCEDDESSLPINTNNVLIGQEQNLPKINEELCQWALDNNITHSALRELLKVLKPHFSTLPSDPRTLLSTPRQIIPKKYMAPGEYHHLGLEKCLHYLIQANNFQQSVCEILINVDGLPLSKSSGSELYPILASLYRYPNIVGLVGLYHGCKKPENSNSFLEDFVKEITQLIKFGFFIKDIKYSVKLKGIICDAPAKAFVKCIKYHTGSFSCTKCEQEGEYIENRMCFPEMNNRERTDEDFITKRNEEHHRDISILEEIPDFGMITGFPLDYMHLICLGVMKKLLVGLWCAGPPPHKLSSHQVEKLSDSLMFQYGNIPSEFCRKPRTLNECKRWKATEFRQFLFYTGPVILKEHLPNDNYVNFLSLHIAVSILANSKSTILQIDYAHSLLMYFVNTFILIYGRHFVSHNIHNLLHITKDVKMFGTLDSFSAFHFENFMQVFLKYTRKPDNPISQIVKRFQEAMKANKSLFRSKRVNIGPSKEHSEGPLIENCNSPQYEQFKNSSFCIRNSHPNNCFGLKNGSIILVRNIATKDDNLIVIGHRYSTKKDFYLNPCPSSYIGIYEVMGTGELECWPLEDISVKYVKLSLQNSNVVVPLLHCESE